MAKFVIKISVIFTMLKLFGKMFWRKISKNRPTHSFFQKIRFYSLGLFPDNSDKKDVTKLQRKNINFLKIFENFMKKQEKKSRNDDFCQDFKFRISGDSDEILMNFMVVIGEICQISI